MGAKRNADAVQTQFDPFEELSRLAEGADDASPFASRPEPPGSPSGAAPQPTRGQRSPNAPLVAAERVPEPSLAEVLALARTLPPTPTPARSDEDLLERDKELYARLSTFLDPEAIDRHRGYMKGRTLERQIEFYQFVDRRRIHPSDDLMVALEVLGFLNDFANEIPGRIDASFLRTLAEIRQAVVGTMAPYGAVPAEIERLTEALSEGFSEERRFHGDRVAELRQSLQDHRVQAEELIVRFDAVAVESKTQILEGLERQANALMAAFLKTSQIETTRLREQREAVAAEFKLAGEAQKAELATATAGAQAELGRAVASMVVESAKIAQTIAAGANSFGRKLAIAAAGFGAGALVAFMIMH